MTHDTDSLASEGVASATTAKAGERDETEIEITPEMIEAGKRELALFSYETCDPDDVVCDIFSAMWSKMKDHSFRVCKAVGRARAADILSGARTNIHVLNQERRHARRKVLSG
jgi:hypothetical protein